MIIANYMLCKYKNPYQHNLYAAYDHAPFLKDSEELRKKKRTDIIKFIIIPMRLYSLYFYFFLYSLETEYLTHHRV